MEFSKKKGFEVDCLHVKDVDPLTVKNYDCVLAGSPAHVLRATGPIMQFLDRFDKDEFSEKLAAAFDTQLQGRITGNAAKRIEKKLEESGFKMVMAPLVLRPNSFRPGLFRIRSRQQELRNFSPNDSEESEAKDQAKLAGGD